MIRCRIFKTVPGIVRPMQARMLVTDWHMLPCVPCLVTQLCLTLCDPMDCSPPGSSVHGDSPGKNTGVGCHAVLQGIFPTRGLNPSLLHCKWILYYLSHQGSPRIVSSLSFLQGIFPTQESNWGLLHCIRILYQLNYQGSS